MDKINIVIEATATACDIVVSIDGTAVALIKEERTSHGSRRTTPDFAEQLPPGYADIADALSGRLDLLPLHLMQVADDAY